MNTNDKKKEVLEMLRNTNDDLLIDEVYDILQPTILKSDIDIQHLPTPIQEKLNRAFDDYKSGNYITHDEMKQKLAQWLSR